MPFGRSKALLIAAAFSGCTSLEARRAINESDELIREAHAEDADRYARYEVTKAALYLEEARQRNGYGEYAAAANYGQQAVELARSAVQTARQRKDLEQRRQKSEPLTPTKRPKDGTPKAEPIEIPGLPPIPVPGSDAPAAPPKKKLLPPGMGGAR